MNHKASMGENKNPILVVPNFCMLKKPAGTIIETMTTVSANNNRLKQIKFSNEKSKLEKMNTVYFTLNPLMAEITVT
jgi:hypothetical protein